MGQRPPDSSSPLSRRTAAFHTASLTAMAVVGLALSLFAASGAWLDRMVSRPLAQAVLAGDWLDSGNPIVPSPLVELSEAARKQAAGRQAFAEFREYRLARQAAVDPSEDGLVSLAAVGDVMLSRTTADLMSAHGADYPFREMSDWLSSADLAVGNLESPIIAGPRVLAYEMNLRADPGSEVALADSGFDLMVLANNHLGDRGKIGVRETLERLDSAGLASVGAGLNDEQAYGPIYREVEGLRLAFLAQTDRRLVASGYGAGPQRPGTALVDVERIGSSVAEARKQADVIVFFLHAGIEYRDLPDDYQRTAAQAAIDAGADLVIGHHPHVVQPFELYEGRPIFYSLGNFVFDQLFDESTQQGLGVKLVFDQRPALVRAELMPVEIKGVVQPRPAEGEAATAILGRLGHEFETVGGASSGSAADSYELSLPPSGLPLGPPGRLENRLYLAAGHLVYSHEGIRWETPHDWWVDSYHLTDLDGDGQPELAVSVWKTGRFGSDRPFWTTDNEDDRLMNRLFVYRLADGQEPAAIWMSSALRRPNCRIAFSDKDNDGQDELYAEAGEYADLPDCRPIDSEAWKWNGFGFDRAE